MLFYKFIFKKVFFSFVLSIITLSSVLYIFSIIEILGNSYNFTRTIALGLINTLELLITIPTIIYVMSIILFWNNTKRTNELLIIRHYLSLKKIIILFSIFVIIFTYLEINKRDLGGKIMSLKENFLKKSNNNELYQKNFYQFDENKLTITRIDGINISDNSLEEVSIYKFENNIFVKSIYSNNNTIVNENIIMKNPKLITPESIKDMNENFTISLKEFGKNYYNSESNIKIVKTSEKNSPFNLLKEITLVIILFTYTSLFLTKKVIQKNASVLKYSLMAFLIFTYTFATSQVYLNNHNSLFHLSVLLTLAFYLYKNFINE